MCRAWPLSSIVSQRFGAGVQFQTWAPSKSLSFLSRASPLRNSRSSGSGSRTSTPKFGIDKFNLTRQRGNLTASSTNRWPTTGQTRPGRFEAHGVRSVLGALRRAAKGSAIARGQEFPTSQVRSAAPLSPLQAPGQGLVGARGRPPQSAGSRNSRRHSLVLDRKPRRI